MRGKKRLLAAAFALCAATAAAPPAHASDEYAYCDPMTPATTALTSDAAGAFAGRGSSREPRLEQTHSDLPRSAKGKATSGFTASVPVWFHIVTDGSTGAVTDSQIAAQIRVLNTTFAGGEGGADTGFTFVLAGVTRTDNAGWFYANPGGVNEQTMKQTLRRGGPETLNVYSTTAGDYLGWAYLPNITTKPGQTSLDGVVVDWESFLGTSDEYKDQYDQGETTTHEVGHWLNLEHTFYGGCSAKGDFVADTPPEKTPTSGCPEGKDTCTQPGEDPIHNYMDYSYDDCYTEFTEGQAQRMADAWLLYRAP
jgi:hypothetical protein